MGVGKVLLNELWTSIYHAKYEPDPSSGLAIISSRKTLSYKFDVKYQNSETLTLRQ